MGKKYGKKELKYLKKAIKSDNLFYANGKMTKRLCKTVRRHFNVDYAAAMSSGTAAIHCALAALEIPPGKEVITSPITDIGTVIGVLYQNLIPVFADVDPHTYNITAESIEKVISDDTRAIIVVHLAGNPAGMDEILNLAEKHQVDVIEDCAQSYGAKYKGKPVGTLARLGCYSLNAYKHISAGDGGFVITNEEILYERVHNYADKFYDRHGKGVRLNSLAPNYRITELQSAVSVAQFDKVNDITESRHALGDMFNKGICGLAGISAHGVKEHSYCSYWFTMIRIDSDILQVDRDEFVKELKKNRVPASAGYIARPLYLEPLFREKNFFPAHLWPAEIISGKSFEYESGLCPIAEDVLDTAIRVSIDENMSEKKIQKMIDGVQKAHAKFIT